MTEHRLFDGDVPFVSTAEFHADRERAPHLEQPAHRPRMDQAAMFVQLAALHAGRAVTVSDLGCGDGGLLSLLAGLDGVKACWGYDFQPSNAAGWAERGVTAYPVDAFTYRDQVELGDVTVTTEVLEHIADPHGALAWIAGGSRYLVASSPADETAESHDACHAWAWDMEGYAAMITAAGFRVLRHERVGQFQVVLAESVT